MGPDSATVASVPRGDAVHKLNVRLPLPLYERLKGEAELGEMSLNKLIVYLLGGERPGVAECDHEPFRSQGRGRCYRCGAVL
jgi:hypothetical protein